MAHSPNKIKPKAHWGTFTNARTFQRERQKKYRIETGIVSTNFRHNHCDNPRRMRRNLSYFNFYFFGRSVFPLLLSFSVFSFLSNKACECAYIFITKWNIFVMCGVEQFIECKQWSSNQNKAWNKNARNEILKHFARISIISICQWIISLNNKIEHSGDENKHKQTLKHCPSIPIRLLYFTVK